jgi:hypothetical protein
MSLNTKKFAAYAATVLLSIVGVGAISAPVQAGEAECQYAKPDAANDKPVATLRLVTPVLTDDNSAHRQDFEGHFVVDCNWFGIGMHFNQVYVPLGLTTTLTYHASKPDGTPLVNTKIQLRANKSYSNSNAKIYVNGHRAFQAKGSVNGDGWNEWSTTDLNGNVTFVVQSPKTCTEYYGMLPPAPTSLDAETPNDKNADPTTDCFAQLLPSLVSLDKGEAIETADFVELHYFDPAGLDNSALAANFNLSAPKFDETNSISTNGVVQTYAEIGSKQTIVVQATRDDGSWIRDQSVKVRINLANSGSNANISAGVVGLNGLATLTKVDATKTTEDQLILTGKTDAFGNIAVVVSNTDKSGENIPSSKTAPVPTTGAKFATIQVTADGIENTASTLEVHYYKPVVILPITVSAAASGKKISVTIKNAIGKKFTVSITGLKKVYVKPTKATQVYTYTVTKGSKTVSVSADGRTLTKKFSIK